MLLCNQSAIFISSSGRLTTWIYTWKVNYRQGNIICWQCWKTCTEEMWHWLLYVFNSKATTCLTERFPFIYTVMSHTNVSSMSVKEMTRPLVTLPENWESYYYFTAQRGTITKTVIALLRSLTIDILMVCVIVKCGHTRHKNGVSRVLLHCRRNVLLNVWQIWFMNGADVLGLNKLFVFPKNIKCGDMPYHAYENDE